MLSCILRAALASLFVLQQDLRERITAKNRDVWQARQVIRVTLTLHKSMLAEIDAKAM